MAQPLLPTEQHFSMAPLLLPSPLCLLSPSARQQAAPSSLKTSSKPTASPAPRVVDSSLDLWPRDAPAWSSVSRRVTQAGAPQRAALRRSSTRSNPSVALLPRRRCTGVSLPSRQHSSGRWPPRSPWQKPLHGQSVLQLQGTPLCSFQQAILHLPGARQVLGEMLR
ncbi:LOW QUALITY PROTEIN: hypothetical protein U9M48_042807 [Paspalum notatum var. saurae]|uniref:Uncharacterized protein n=1 Tax=Paspalum notatum var. saurae TaxID=547442 RepID=A0AAQ3XFT5_PASNO